MPDKNGFFHRIKTVAQRKKPQEAFNAPNIENNSRKEAFFSRNGRQLFPLGQKMPARLATMKRNHVKLLKQVAGNPLAEILQQASKTV